MVFAHAHRNLLVGRVHVDVILQGELRRGLNSGSDARKGFKERRLNQW
jgi:hypothetical protein